MSTHHSETEHEHKQDAPSMHNQETIPDHAAFPVPSSPPPSRPKSRRSLIVLISVLVVVLAASTGVIVLVHLGRQPIPPTPTHNPTSTTIATTTPVLTSTPPPTVTATATVVPGQWIQVLTGYRVTELVAAPSHPNVLYACAIPPGFPIEYRSVQTVLRSADVGATWQDIGKHAQMSRGCELTINPTDNNEIYVATSSNPPTAQAVPSYVLEHTSSGGDSWETIHPTVHVSSLSTTLAWQGTQLRFVNNRLYSVQAVPVSLTQTPQGNQVMSHVIMSTDGGYIWNVLDTQLATSGRSAEAYVVNPAHPAIFYELAYVPVAPGTGFPPLELYQSVDGGQTWQSVLQHIPWLAPLTPATILTGSENANAIYLTNTRCPAPQALRAGGGPRLQPLAGSPFSVCMSSDAGKTWQTITAPNQLADTMGEGIVDREGRLYAQATTSNAREIWRYNPTPAPASWSKVTQAPDGGTLLAGTATGANGTTVLWLMSTGGQATLYRYAI